VFSVCKENMFYKTRPHKILQGTKGTVKPVVGDPSVLYGMSQKIHILISQKHELNKEASVTEL